MIENVGKQLRQARLAQEISLEEVSKELHIRARYLQALENGDLSVLPSAVQVRGFLRSYADYLQLDSQQLLDSLQQPEPEPDQQDPPPTLEAPAQDSIEIAKAVSAIYQEIGHSIQQRRETLGLSVEDIEEHTHIPAHYVGYIESGQFENFPSPVQARGMLGNYVDFLEMDANTVLLRYAEALQTGLAARQPIQTISDDEIDADTPESSPPQTLRMPLWLRSIISPDTILIGVVGTIIIGVTIWGIGRITRTISEAVPQPTAPSLVEVLLPSPTPEASPTATLLATPTLQLLDVGDDEEGEVATAIPTIPVAGQSNIQLYVIVRQRTYLKVTVDGDIEFEGRTTEGSTLAFTGNQTVEVLTGNAAALQIFFNEQDLGSLGIIGEVTNLVFTRDGVIIPTATPTPTLSPEEILELTPTTTLESDPDVPDAVDTPIP
jgi:cytoskeletal protein RodZ